MGGVAWQIPLSAGDSERNALAAGAQVQNTLNAQQENTLRAQMAPLQQASGMQSLQAGAVDLQARQLQLDQTRAINQAYRDAFTPDQNGNLTLDQGKLTQALATSGHGAAIPGILKANMEYQQAAAALAKTNGEVAAQRNDFAGSIAAAIQAANNEPHYAVALLTDAFGRKAIDPQVAMPNIQKIQQALQADPSGATARAFVAQATATMLAQSPKQRELATSAMTAQGSLLRGQAAQSNATRQAQDDEIQQAVSGIVSNPLKTQAEYQALLDGLSHGAAKRLEAIVPPAQYDPSTSPKILQNGVLKPEQQVQAEAAAKRNAEIEADRKAQEEDRKANLAIRTAELAIQQNKAKNASPSYSQADVDAGVNKVYGSFTGQPKATYADAINNVNNPAYFTDLDAKPGLRSAVVAEIATRGKGQVAEGEKLSSVPLPRVPAPTAPAPVAPASNPAAPGVAQPARPATAPGVPRVATAAQVAAYATTKRIPLAQAQNEFKQSGYVIQ
jgi:hypothetical protein